MFALLQTFVNIADTGYNKSMYGSRLAIERRRLGLSQALFAPYLGISRSALAMVETDRSPLDVARLCELAEKVGLDPIFVLTGESSTIAAGKLLDWDLVMNIQKGIHSWCQEHELVLTPEKQTLILKILYYRFSRSSGDIGEALEDTFKLAA